MRNIRYIEVELDHFPRNQDGTDGDVVGECSICILAERVPTIQEAAEFCFEEMNRAGYEYVVNVLEIDEEEARSYVDPEQEKRVQVFK